MANSFNPQRNPCSCSMVCPINFPCPGKNNPSIGNINHITNSNYTSQKSSSSMVTGYVEVDDEMIKHVKDIYKNYMKAERAQKTTKFYQTAEEIFQKKYTTQLESEPSVSKDIFEIDTENQDTSNFESFDDAEEVTEEPCVKTLIPPSARRNMYWPPTEDDIIEKESIQPVTVQPIQEEMCTKTVLGPNSRRNMYWPPNDNEQEQNY